MRPRVVWDFKRIYETSRGVLCVCVCVFFFLPLLYAPTVVPSILILSEFYYQLTHKRIALRGILKFTLKQFQHVSVQTP